MRMDIIGPQYAHFFYMNLVPHVTNFRRVKLSFIQLVTFFQLLCVCVWLLNRNIKKRWRFPPSSGWGVLRVLTSKQALSLSPPVGRKSKLCTGWAPGRRSKDAHLEKTAVLQPHKNKDNVHRKHRDRQPKKQAARHKTNSVFAHLTVILPLLGED